MPAVRIATAAPTRQAAGSFPRNSAMWALSTGYHGISRHTEQAARFRAPVRAPVICRVLRFPAPLLRAQLLGRAPAGTPCIRRNTPDLALPAEGPGFEPGRPLTRPNGFQDRPDLALHSHTEPSVTVLGDSYAGAPGSTTVRTGPSLSLSLSPTT